MPERWVQPGNLFAGLHDPPLVLAAKTREALQCPAPGSSDEVSHPEWRRVYGRVAVRQAELELRDHAGEDR